MMTFDEEVMQADPPINKRKECEFCGKDLTWKDWRVCDCEGFTNYLHAKQEYINSLLPVFHKRRLLQVQSQVADARDALRRAEAEKRFLEEELKKAESNLSWRP